MHYVLRMDTGWSGKPLHQNRSAKDGLVLYHNRDIDFSRLVPLNDKGNTSVIKFTLFSFQSGRPFEWTRADAKITQEIEFDWDVDNSKEGRVFREFPWGTASFNQILTKSGMFIDTPFISLRLKK